MNAYDVSGWAGLGAGMPAETGVAAGRLATEAGVLISDWALTNDGARYVREIAAQKIAEAAAREGAVRLTDAECSELADGAVAAVKEALTQYNAEMRRSIDSSYDGFDIGAVVANYVKSEIEGKFLASTVSLISNISVAAEAPAPLAATKQGGDANASATSGSSGNDLLELFKQSGNVQLMFAAVQTNKAEERRAAAEQLMGVIANSQLAQKQVAKMIQIAEKPNDEKVTVPAAYDENGVPVRDENGNVKYKETTAGNAMSEYCTANGITYTNSDSDANVAALKAYQETLLAEKDYTQTLLLEVQQMIDQYNSMTQGAMSSVTNSMNVLQTIIRNAT